MESQLQRTCMVHYQKIICICTHKNCKNRLICVYCIKYHEGGHNKSIIPYEEIFSNSDNTEDTNSSSISFFKKFRDFYSKKCENILTSSSKLPDKVLDKINETLGEVKNNFLELFIEYQSKVNELVEKFNLKHEDIEKSFVNAMDKMADFENQSQVNAVNYSSNNEIDINKICEIYLKIKSGILSNLDKELEMQENLLMNYSLNFDNSLQIEKNNLNRCLKENLDHSLKNITKIFSKLNNKSNVTLTGGNRGIINKPIKSFSEPIKIVSLINNWLSAKFISDPMAKSEDKNRLYFFEGYHSSSLDMYENLEEFVKGNISKSYRNISPEFGSNHAVVYNEMFYFVEYESGQTNNIIKYDLEKKQVLIRKTLRNALVGKYSQVGGCNDIILHSTVNGIYAFYTTEENKHRIVISLLDEENLEIKETWNTESKAKKEIGNPFIVGTKVYCYEKYNEKPTRLCFMYDLESKVTDNYFNVLFQNEGGQDYSLTYHDNLDCFLTVSNKIVYKYEASFDEN